LLSAHVSVDARDHHNNTFVVVDRQPLDPVFAKHFVRASIARG
jgi:hypothetical protein